MKSNIICLRSISQMIFLPIYNGKLILTYLYILSNGAYFEFSTIRISWGSKKAYLVKKCAGKIDDFYSVPGTHMEKRTNSHKFFSDLMCTH